MITGGLGHLGQIVFTCPADGRTARAALIGTVPNTAGRLVLVQEPEARTTRIISSSTIKEFL